MQSIYTFSDYRRFLGAAFEARSKNGFGEGKKLADAMGVHPTFVSQVLKDVKSFSVEQALVVTRYLNLNDLEADYFLLLVQHDRAGTKELKSFFSDKLKALREKANQVVNRVDRETKLSPEAQATFYSDWTYSACRLATLLPKTNTAESLAAFLGLSQAKLKSVTDFLIGIGLLKLEGGRFSIGPLSTHLDHESPWIKAHHTNWRQKALERLSDPSEKELHYSGVSTVSREDMDKIKEILLQSLQRVDKVIGPSPSETLVCLNIDWFEVKPDHS